MTFLAGALVYILCIIFLFRLAGVLAHFRPYFVDRFTTERGMEFARRYSPDKEQQRNAIGTESALSTVDSSTAPDSSKPILEKMMKSSRVIPNRMVMFANGPAAPEGYHVLGSVWDDGSLPPANDNSSFLLQALKNQCSHCIAAHSIWIALKTICNYPDRISPVPVDPVFLTESQ